MGAASPRPPRTIFFFVFVLVLLPCLSASHSFPSHFELWRELHQKVYSSSEEMLRRYRIYQDNLDFINWHNSQPGITYGLAPNAFADLTLDEFRATRLGLLLRSGPPSLHHDGDAPLRKHGGDGNQTVLGGGDRREASDFPESVDWRAKGVVTGVKDQGNCGVAKQSGVMAAVGPIAGSSSIVGDDL